MEEKTGNILVVDDDQDVLLAARLLLKPHYKTVQTEKDPQNITTLLKNDAFDVILLDMNFEEDSSGAEGFYWLSQIQKLDPSVVVIFITAFGDIEKAVRAIKEGAMDFILKPWQNEKLLATVSAAMQLRTSRRELQQVRFQQKQLSADLDNLFPDIIGNSSSIREIFNVIAKVADTDANVLILGESGTGKELVARAIHRQSGKAENVFISVDLGAISETLFESELFGHVKGAFTGAKEDRAGRFEVASGGTLFLDEIGNLPLSLQAKLLRVLQTHQVVRLGSNKATPIDIRLICATNMPIYKMVEENKFRQDLLYRINTVEINLPPLRERTDDIPPLIDHYVNTYSHKYNKSIRTVTPSVIKRLQKYAWPGNIRELQHAIERAVIMSDSDVLQPTDFILSPAPASSESELQVDSYNLEHIEKLTISKALRKHGGNVSHAARELGLTRAALYRRMEKYNL
ncbi:MAG: response regulator [Caldithrix sp.]|nr:response regulator [Caldithrix sp.]